MSWAARRRLIIFFILVVFFGGLTFLRYKKDIFRAPTCTDGKQNGTETGIDCGGNMCTNLCVHEVKIPTVIWQRSFAITDSVYNATAYIENKNEAATKSIAYEFRLYDPNDVLVARRQGSALIPPLGRYAIVETGIAVGNTSVKRTTFDFSKTPALWEKVPESVSRLRINTSNVFFDESGLIPRLNALITNPSPTVTLNNTSVAAILYDANDNAVNVSQTLVQVLSPNASAPIFFTWPRPLTAPVVRYEIAPIIDVFHTQ
jgi:hypothetical protein